MKIKPFLYLTFFLLIILIGCTNRNTTELQKDTSFLNIKANLLEAKTDTIKLSEIAEKVEYIPLQTTDSVLLGNIQWFVAKDSDYFLQEDYSSIVYRYNKNGKFLNKMFKVGRGPGETLPFSFTIDDAKKQFYVLTNSFEIELFDYNGNFIKNIHKPDIDPVDYTTSIGFFNNTLFSSQIQNPIVKYIYYCIDFNSDTNKILYKNFNNYDKINPQIRLKMFWLDDYNYQITDSHILFKERFCDTVFKVDKGLKIEPRFIIELGNMKLKWETYRDDCMLYEGLITPQFDYPNGYWLNSVTETKSFLFLVFRSFNEPQIFGVYNKNTSSLTLLKNKFFDYRNEEIVLKNDIDNLVAFPPMNNLGRLSFHEECLYSVIDAENFVKAYRSSIDEINNSSEYLHRMDSTFNSITEFDNHIIMKVYLK